MKKTAQITFGTLLVAGGILFGGLQANAAESGTGPDGTRVTGEDNREYGTDGTRVTGTDSRDW